MVGVWKIAMMGSEIKVVSELGVGSTFYFTLEMDAEARPARDSEGDRTNANEEQVCRFPRMKGCRVLVIAPRLVRRLVLVDALQTLGMEIAVVDDIKEAMPMIFPDALHFEGEKSPEIRRRDASGASSGHRAFECIALDADDWDSDRVLEFAERVRVDHSRRGQVAHCYTPVVLVAACSFTAEMEERIGRIPCASKLHKPISSRNCGAAIMKALGSSRGTPHVEKADQAPTKESSNSGIHVLVVDDNLVSQKVACKLLERICIDSTAVSSAQSAIAALAEGHPFDAVFMDVQMPDMDGIEATEILRAKGVKSKNLVRGLIPIFAMTADATKEMEAQCSKAGMDGFIPKPMDPGKLFDIMAPFFPL